MGETLVSVKRVSSSAGRPKGKKHYLVLFRWEDVEDFTKDTDGITVTALTFKEGKTPIGVYATSKTIKAWDTLTGDTDAKGYLHHVGFESPGDTKEMASMRNQLVNEDLGAIVINCNGEDAKLAGSPCTPLVFSSDEGQDDTEACKNVIELASEMPSSPLARIPLSLIPQTDDDDINTYLGLTAGAAEESEGGV